MAEKWDVEQIPNQEGRLAVITGSNSGIGFEAAKALAAAGAKIVLAVRNEQKGQQAVAAIRRVTPQADVTVEALDLADLASIQNFAERMQKSAAPINLLINNAGVMAPPYRTTQDGFELQFGTNHLGHFALTGLLLPQVTKAPDARIVTVSSMAHTGGRIDFDNLDGRKGYKRWRAYGQSKLANLLFAYELNRRLQAANLSVMSVACHPGFAATNLTAAGFGMNLGGMGRGIAVVANLMAQSAYMGALPTLYAATASDVQSGQYIGPQGKSGMRGYPGPAQSNTRSRDEAVAKRLWDVSQTLTGVHFL